MSRRNASKESLAGRLLRTVQWVTTLTAAVATVVVFILFHNILDSQLDADLERQSDSFIEKATAAPNVRILEKAAPQTFSKDTLYFQIWDRNGTSIAKSSNLTNHFRLPLPAVGVDTVTPKFVLPNGEKARSYTTSFTLQNPEPQAYYLTVARPLGAMRRALIQIVAVLVLSWIATIALLTVILPKTLQKGIEPVNVLAQKLALEDKPSLDPESLPTEIRPFARKIELLLGNLSDSLEREKRFRADVAHELRNPIAELLVHSEILIEEAVDEDVSQNETLKIAQRMARLVDALSVIHEAGELHQELTRETIDIRSMIDSVIEGQLIAKSRISVALEPLSTGFGDPHILRAILDNLITNACDYTPEDQLIEIESQLTDFELTLQVKNPCEGLEQADLSNLSLPFWRKDAARSHCGHYGLGLAICQAYCEVIGAKLSFTIEENIHFIATLIVPRVALQESPFS